LELDKGYLLQRVNIIEEAIKQRCTELKQLVDQKHNQLLEELNRSEEVQLKEIAARKNDIEKQLTTVENVGRYFMEVIDKGSACDVSRSANSLILSADELMTSHTACTKDKYCPIELTFEPADISVITSGQQILIGSILSNKLYEEADQDEQEEPDKKQDLEAHKKSNEDTDQEEEQEDTGKELDADDEHEESDEDQKKQEDFRKKFSKLSFKDNVNRCVSRCNGFYFLEDNSVFPKPKSFVNPKNPQLSSHHSI